MKCACVETHTPNNSDEIDLHHVLPQSWGGQAVDSTKLGFTRLVPLCPTSHRRTHRLLNMYVKRGRAPTAAEVKAVGEAPFNTLQRQLAKEAWEHPDRPTAPHYTLTAQPSPSSG